MQAFRTLTTELGLQATPARPALLKLRTHPDPQVRQAARKALERLAERVCPSSQRYRQTPGR